jgi:tRNA(Arg) A34 adenosine deaminase TadA
MENSVETHLRHAIQLAIENAGSGLGGPFGTVIAKGDEVIATGVNLVTLMNDPTAHSEIKAIRSACQKLGTFDLSGCDVYASCEPCPMCLGAVYWARVSRVYFACTRDDAARAGFSDELIYEELRLPPPERHLPMASMLREEGLEAFRKWLENGNRAQY